MNRVNLYLAIWLLCKEPMGFKISTTHFPIIWLATEFQCGVLMRLYPDTLARIIEAKDALVWDIFNLWTRFSVVVYLNFVNSCWGRHRRLWPNTRRLVIFSRQAWSLSTRYGPSPLISIMPMLICILALLLHCCLTLCYLAVYQFLMAMLAEQKFIPSVVKLT